MSFDRTCRSPRGQVYQTIVTRYRRRRSTPRDDAPNVWEDPAPDWVWRLAEAVLEHTAREEDAGRRWLEEALAWCECGPPAARSAALVELLKAPAFGAPPLARLRVYLDRAWGVNHVA